MSEFSKKLRREVVDPAQSTNRVYTFTAKVIKTNEKKNTCTVKFTDEEGKEQTKSGVSVTIPGNDNTGGWMPSKGDNVMVHRDSDKNYRVTARVEDDYQKYATKYNLAKDIYSDLENDDFPGVLY